MYPIDELKAIYSYLKANIDVCGCGNSGKSEISGIKLYPDSVRYSGSSLYFMFAFDGTGYLAICGNGKQSSEGFDGEVHCFDEDGCCQEALPEGNGICIKVCLLNNDNAGQLRKIFKFTGPVSHKGKPITIGLGDRLGLASPGHIRLLKGKDIFPVLAQQSIRELNLTARTYDDVLASATWAVFREGYLDGYGADGDHLKTPDEVKMALDKGFTMITLDCSEHIDNDAANLSAKEADKKYASLPELLRKRLEGKYAERSFKINGGFEVKFVQPEYVKIVLIYHKAIEHAVNIYKDLIRDCGRDIDFEMSIDETLTPTSPAAHYFAASELIAGGVEITSLAPRFCGEFQKGIDYRGNIKDFAADFEMHARIADTLGYKISVHSGSDKFSVFPIIGEKTSGRYHVKTAGTNWLEAVRLIAVKKPSLYREMHAFAVSHLPEARKYYHISAVPEKVPDISKMKDNELPALMDLDDSRQILHITYGLILNARDSRGALMLRDAIYDVLIRHEDEYAGMLQKHIGRHLEKLGAL